MSANFIQHFVSIEDPRIDRCKRHELIDILDLAQVGVRLKTIGLGGFDK